MSCGHFCSYSYDFFDIFFNNLYHSMLQPPQETYFCIHHLHQTCQTQGPWATSGPWYNYIWPVIKYHMSIISGPSVCKTHAVDTTSPRVHCNSEDAQTGKPICTFIVHPRSTEHGTVPCHTDVERKCLIDFSNRVKKSGSFWTAKGKTSHSSGTKSGDVIWRFCAT